MEPQNSPIKIRPLSFELPPKVNLIQRQIQTVKNVTANKETLIHLLFDCNKFENERQKLKKIIESILNKNKISWHSIRAEELLGEHQLKPEDAKKVRLEVLKFLSNTEKDI